MSGWISKKAQWGEEERSSWSLESNLRSKHPEPVAKETENLALKSESVW